MPPAQGQGHEVVGFTGAKANPHQRRDEAKFVTCREAEGDHRDQTTVTSKLLKEKLANIGNYTNRREEFEDILRTLS